MRVHIKDKKSADLKKDHDKINAKIKIAQSILSSLGYDKNEIKKINEDIDKSKKLLSLEEEKHKKRLKSINEEQSEASSKLSKTENSVKTSEKTLKAIVSEIKKSEGIVRELKQSSLENSRQIIEETGLKTSVMNAEMKEIIENIYNLKKNEEYIVLTIERQQNTLNGIEQLIKDKNAELIALEKSIEDSKKLLESKNITTGKLEKKLEELKNTSSEKNDKIKQLSSEIEKKDKELNIKNKQAEEASNKFLSFVKREERVNALIPEIKAICKKIGVNPKLD